MRHAIIMTGPMYPGLYLGDLVEVLLDFPAKARPNLRWAMNLSTFMHFCCLCDANGITVWKPRGGVFGEFLTLPILVIKDAPIDKIYLTPYPDMFDKLEDGEYSKETVTYRKGALYKQPQEEPATPEPPRRWRWPKKQSE